MTIVQLKIPPAPSGEIVGTGHQKMVEEEYGRSFEPLTHSQAITLHNWYMYVKAVVWRAIPQSAWAFKQPLIRAATNYVSQQPTLSASIDDLMQQRFRRRASGNLENTIHRSPQYNAVISILDVASQELAR